MPLLSFEGVEVDVPTELKGIQFTFVNGTLSLRCSNFTGDIVLAKPMPADLSLNDFPFTKVADVGSSGNQEFVIQATQGSSKKRPSSEHLDDSMQAEDSDDSDLLRKRMRPNFLSDIEQTMLLAQLESSQQSLRDSSVGVVDASQTTMAAPASDIASPEKEVVVETSQADLKTPAKPKKPTVSHMKSFFSPEPKELATKKAPDSGSKRASRPNSAVKSKADSTQTSILSMMMSQATSKTVAPTPKQAAQPTAASWSLVQATGSIPSERWGHTVTRISGDRVVVYGGADDNETTLGDLHVFDINKNEWSKPLNCESIPRTWHDAVYLDSKNLLLVFGGERATGDDQLEVLSDIMVLDTECFLWYPPAVSGSSPTARSGHSCTVVGNDVVVFGGSRGRSRQSAVHVLDSDSWHWKTVKVEGKPPTARTYHSAVALGGDSVVYFGGNDSKKSFDSVHVLKKSEEKADTWTWFHPCVVGTAPRPRTGHSATLVDDTKVLIFGGWDPNSGEAASTTNVFDDAFLLDTVTWEWESVKMREGDAVPGRVGHSAVLGKDRSVLLFGGQNATEQRLNDVHTLTLEPASPLAT